MVWNSSTGIPSPPLALSWSYLRPIWLCTPRCLALGECSHHHCYLGHEDLFLYNSSVYSCHLFLISSALLAQMVKSLPVVWETWVRSLGGKDPLGKGNGNPLQYSWLENPMDGVAWQTTAHEIAKSRTQLSDFTFCCAAAAKLFQSCPTLCHPIDGSPPGSPVPGILQASVLYCAHLYMKCSLGISNFLEEISSLSHSDVFL